MKATLKKIKKEHWILLLLFGVLLVILAVPTSSDESGKKETSVFSIEEENISPDGYDELEEKLAETLAQAEGVGRTRVVLTYDSKDERVLPSVQGVLIIAEGGDNPVVAENIRDAVLSLFPVEAHKIKVMKMKS